MLGLSIRLRQFCKEFHVTKHALIHGTGLIGGSIGLALKGNGWEVSGWDPDGSALEQALRRRSIDRVAANRGDLVDQSDLIVLAGPAQSTIEALTNMDTSTLVTDVASIKAPIVTAGAHLPNFVAGHPMAGSAASGATHASAHLFYGASWVLCDDSGADEAVTRISDVVQELGANPVLMTGEQHDRYVALVSHLPRVLASSLVELVATEPEARQLTAGSFRDLTRVAASNPEWWSTVLEANRDQLGYAIDALISRLEEWKRTIDDGAATTARLAGSAEERSEFGAPVAEVRVVLFDRPGEVARVGMALSESNVDLRDIQLRHAEHGGGGILTLSVNDIDASDLRAALDTNGFEMENG